YKRFLSDVVLEADGDEVVAHCPNPGAMTGLAEPGQRVWLEPNDDPKKKLKFGWRITELSDGQFACIDTSLANKVVGEALRAGEISPYGQASDIRAEVPYGEGSRVDFLVSENGRDTYLEVKSVTLMRESGLAEFPDTVTKRGAKHLRELAKLAAGGTAAAMIYLVQRTDCHVVGVAADIDPDYAKAAKEAKDAGVAFQAYAVDISSEGLKIARLLDFKGD
ncbi:MAG: DNA/RNA nuclease SfsA, partial [Boseongicola sp.]|nr:DNA/RNA nuclease SfsA [Boseongicola sp.]